MRSGCAGFWAAAAAAVLLAGCGGSGGGTAGAGKSGTGKANDAHDHAGHDHAGHDHGGHSHAAHGPHGGHILEIGDEEYHAEWTHDDDSGLITVYVLDSSMKKEVPIPAKEIVIATKVAGKEHSYSLAAVNPSEGDEPKSAMFQLDDKALVVALQAAGTPGTSATLKLEIGGKPFSVEFKKDEGGHKH